MEYRSSRKSGRYTPREARQLSTASHRRFWPQWDRFSRANLSDSKGRVAKQPGRQRLCGDKGAIVHHISKQPEDIPRINMLLIEKAGKTHYTRIKNLNRLLYDSSKHKERKHFCERCLHGFTREDYLEAHKPECRGIGQTAVRVDMPKEGENKLAFQNYHKQVPAPLHHLRRLRLSLPRSRGPSPTPRRATLRGRSTTRPVVTATSLFGVMAVQSRRSNIAAPMRRGTSWNHCRKKSAKSRPC